MCVGPTHIRLPLYTQHTSKTGTAQLPPQQAYVTPLQLPPRQQQYMNMPRVMAAAAGTVGGVLGVQVGVCDG